MITSPSTLLLGDTPFNTVYALPHEMQFRFFIDDVLYEKRDLKDVPRIERLLFESPQIGIVTTGTLDFTIYPKSEIPKAARIFCECQLTTKDGLYTSWYPIGTYFVSRRQSTGQIMNLQCRDSMVKAGRKYAPLTQFDEWPVSCTDVCEEIAENMGVTLDARSPLNPAYTVDHPNDLLMSEVLAMIGAMHGGTWVITAENKLRMIPYPDPAKLAPVQDISMKYCALNEYSTGNSSISRVTLSDNAGNEFSYGTDDGLEMGCKCFYCTAQITQAVFNQLDGVLYRPYEIETAYISPLVEVGDAILITMRTGVWKKLIIGYMNLRLSITSRADLRFGVEPDDEEEVPYISAEDLRASRTVSQLGTYYGNRINRTEGFVSEFIQDGVAVARMTANANEFSMKQNENGQWKNRIHFDAVKGEYVIDGKVKIQSVEDLEDGLHNTAEYIFAADGFNAKLVSDSSFQATDGKASSAKSTAEYVASAAGFNALLTSNADYTQSKATIQATAAGLLTKVEKGSVISSINQSAESITINANRVNFEGAEISLTGKVSANNNVVIDTNGLLTAKNMKAIGGTFTNITATGKLTGGNWTILPNTGRTIMEATVTSCTAVT